ncbi:GH13162 [Drosophila grimshawi]|uniref:GH13162 n=1 Tax=Drosophila grimshawi TaxID=7222 RepID=B4JQM0_DROGR|nr:GH13162 [Drosophila grimshawi]
MAMYFYASKISAIACGTRSKQTVLQKSRGQRDRDKDIYRQRGCLQQSSDSETSTDEADSVKPSSQFPDVGIFSLDVCSSTVETTTPSSLQLRKALEQENECAAQLDASELELGFRQFESSVLGSGGIMYINGKIVSGPLDSFTDVLIPKNVNDLDKEFLFSFLLSSRLFLRPHELLGKLLDSVPDSECLETLVALLAEWTQKFPYDYRDERMMNHIKHIVARCSNSHLEAAVSQVLSALLNRLTDLEGHEADLRACQISNDKQQLASALNCTTATQYAQVLCRLEKKLAKHIGPEEFLQCSSLVLLDKQKKWDQPSSSAGPQGAQDPKKTCNLETYLDWSARLRLFVCNEILQCRGIEERSRTVEVWSGVAQYCLLVGNYNSATAILESLESPAISRLKITVSVLYNTFGYKFIANK